MHTCSSASVCPSHPLLSAGLGSTVSKAEAVALCPCSTQPHPRHKWTPSRRSSVAEGVASLLPRGEVWGPGPWGTSARGAAMRSKPAPCGVSLLLWREKRGCQPFWFSWGAGSLLLYQRRPSPEAGKVRGRADVKNAATFAPLGHHSSPSPSCHCS